MIRTASVRQLVAVSQGILRLGQTPTKGQSFWVILVLRDADITAGLLMITLRINNLKYNRFGHSLSLQYRSDVTVCSCPGDRSARA